MPITDADKDLLATLDPGARDDALGLVNQYLDGQSPVLTAAPPTLEDVINAVLRAAGIEEATDPATVEEPTAEMAEARHNWIGHKVAVLQSLPTIEAMFARSAEALLAALVRQAQMQVAAAEPVAEPAP